MKKQQLKLFLVAAAAATTLFAQSATAQWVAKTAVPGTGRWGSLHFALDGKIYVGGGYIGNFVNYNDMHMYDPATDTWAVKNNLPGAGTMRTAGVAFVINGKAYLGLGAENYNNFSPAPTYLKDLWEYNPTADTWTKKADLPGMGRADAAVFVANNKAYVVGGTTSSSPATQTDEVWEYDPASNAWAAKTAIPVGNIYSATGFAISGKGYVMGGSSGGTTPMFNDKVYEYNPTANSWAAKAALPATADGRAGGSAFVIGGNAYYGWGTQSMGSTATFYADFFAYNPNSNMWTNMTGMTGAGRAYGVAQAVGSKGYIGGGWSRVGANQTFYNQFYEVDPSTLSVSKIKSGATVNTYPNPATNVLYISTELQDKNVMYAFYNITGQKVLSGKLNTDNKIDIGSVPAGHYVLEVYSENGSGKTPVSVVR